MKNFISTFIIYYILPITVTILIMSIPKIFYKLFVDGDIPQQTLTNMSEFAFIAVTLAPIVITVLFWIGLKRHQKEYRATSLNIESSQK